MGAETDSDFGGGIDVSYLEEILGFERAERRGGRRAAPSIARSVSLYWTEDGEERGTHGFLSDLSEGGFRGEFAASPAVGALLRVRIVLGIVGERDYGVIHSAARVLSSRTKVVGIREIGCSLILAGDRTRRLMSEALSDGWFFPERAAA